MELSIFYDVNPNVWVTTLGYFGLTAVILAETGLFFCFFLPGDSLLFAAGLFAAKGIFNIYLLLSLFVVAAFVGYAMGYGIGYYLENGLSARPDTWYFKRSYLERAHLFYDKHGKKALLFGRLVPVVRSFVPVIAGMIHMPVWIYMLFNFLGSVLWVGGMMMLGYFLGGVIPDLSEYILLVVMIVIVLSFFPAIVEWYRRR